MSDGCMLFNREEKWKEIKLARIFAHDNILKIHRAYNIKDLLLVVFYIIVFSYTYKRLKVKYITNYKKKIIFYFALTIVVIYLLLKEHFLLKVLLVYLLSRLIANLLTGWQKLDLAYPSEQLHMMKAWD